MSEALASQPSSKAGKRWLDLTKRILVGVVMVLAALALIVDMAGLVGVWAARAPAISDVTDVTATMTHALGTVDNGLTRVNTQVQDARQILTQVNNEAANLGDQVQANSPLVTRLSQLVGNDLSPRVENVRATASDIHDAVVSFNALLVVLNRQPTTRTARLDDALGSVSTRAQEAQDAVQDASLRSSRRAAGRSHQLSP